MPARHAAAGAGRGQPAGPRGHDWQPRRHRLERGAWLIDDTYNANPGSLNAAIDTLAAMPGEHWLVLGDMRELGGDAPALHAEAGRRAQLLLVTSPLIGEGKTLQEVKAANPTLGYRSQYGTDSGSWTTDMFVEAAYASLIKK